MALSTQKRIYTMTIASAANLKITHTPGAGCQSQSIWEDSIYGGQKIIRVGRSGVGRAWFVSVEAPTPTWRMAKMQLCNVLFRQRIV